MICFKLKKESIRSKQYRSYLLNIDTCIKLLKKKIEEYIGETNIIGINKHNLFEIYVKEKDKFLEKGTSKNAVIFKEENEERVLYSFKKNSKIYKRYLELLEEYNDLVNKSRKPYITPKDYHGKYALDYIGEDIFLMINKSDLLSHNDNKLNDEDFEEYSCEKYKKALQKRN